MDISATNLVPHGLELYHICMFNSIQICDEVETKFCAKNCVPGIFT